MKQRYCSSFALSAADRANYALRQEAVHPASRPAHHFKEYLRPYAAAEYLGVSESTLAKLRMRHNRKNGPRFAKQGGCVFYRRADLDTWIERNLISVEDFQ